MKAKPTFERQLIGLAVAACFAGIVHANPTGPAVANGSASFATTGNTLTVTNTPGAIINWQAFSIRPDEVTRFIQSGAASAVLNRVTGPGQSALLGQLLSNGRVFLINPNGVVIGAGARIDTAGFVASSLNLSNEDFLAGRFRFTDPGNAGKVTNAGSINAHSGGPVYLIAPTVENHGVITAPNGDILLAAGKSVELVSTGSPHLRVQVQAGGEAVNVGQLLADSGRVGLYGAAIRNAGTISADSASVNAAGNVVLKASRDVTLEGVSVVSASGGQGGAVYVQAEQGTLLVEGRVDAKGATGAGGDVKLLGTQVGLVGSAAVDASGRTRGGTVLVGGDYQGKNPEIQNAARVVLAPDAKVVADATERGDGGRVIVWSDEYTGFYGTISARAGAAGGNGGFVETSSKDNLQALGVVDAGAAAGLAGQWLLDPANVTISAAATVNGAFGGGSPNIFNTAANNAVANVGTIVGSLNLGTSVTINTTPGGAQPGNITLAAATPIAKTLGGAAALTLNAQGNIVLNSAITSSSGALGVNLNAGLGGAGTVTLNNTSLNGGTLTVNAPGAVTQTAATTLQAATALVKQGAGAMTLSQANTYTGATTLSAGTTNVTNAAGFGTIAGGTTVAAGATLNVNNVAIGAEAVTLSGTLQGTGAGAALAGTVALGAGTAINTAAVADTLALSGIVSGANALTKNGTGTLTLSGANTYTGVTTINAGTVVASNATALGTVAGGATVAAGATLNINNVAIGAEAVTLNGTLQGTGAAAALAGTVALGAASALSTAAVGDTLTLTGVVSGANALNKNGAGTVVLGGAAANTYTGATNINAGTLRVGAATNKITDTSAVTVVLGATLDLSNISETVGSIAGAGNVTLGTGTLTAGGNNATTAYSGVMSGIGGGLTKLGTGTLTLSGANLYTGATAINAGTVVASNTAALGTVAGGTTVAAGATLNVNNVAIGAEAVTLNGTGVGAAGALQGTGTASLAGNVTLATASTVGVTAAADTLTLSGIVGGANALTKAGAGTLTLSGANTYSGATTINAGTVVASNAGALGTVAGGTTVAAGATLNVNNVAIGAEALTLNGTLQGTGAGAALAGTVALGAANAVNTAAAGDTLTLSGVVSGANALNKNGAGTVVLAGAANNTYTGVTNINAGTLVASKAGALGTVAGGTAVANGATLRINNVAIGAEAVTLNGTGVGGNGALQGTGAASLTGTVTLASASTIGAPALADTLTLSGVVGGANDLTKVGSGTVVLSGAAANTYGGATNVNAGTLRVGSAGNKITDASAVTVAVGATLDLNGFNETIGSLAGAGNVTLGTGTLTAGGDNTTTTYSGVMSSGVGGGLTKAGTGTLTLSGANSYSGTTNITAGTLTAANASALGTIAGGTTVTAGATLNLNNVAIGAEAVTLNGNGVAGVGALTGTGAASLGGQVTVATASRVGAAPGNSLALNGTIQGPGALDVAGGGTVTFGNTAGNLTPLASLTSAAGTALNVNGGLVRTTGTQTYNGSLTTGGPTTLQTTNANVTANGAVTATAGTLTLNTGTGNVTMTNAANDFGTVAVTSGGAVSLVDQNALALGAANLATLQAQTLAGNLTLNGAVTASGGGNSIVLAPGGSLVNNAGPAVLVVPVGGRWLVYLAAPANVDAVNGPASGNQAVWGTAYPAAVGAGGNRYVFATSPTLTFTSTDAAKAYGDIANVSGNYSVSGYVNAATYGSVFTQDTAANTFTGAPSVTSAGTPAIANVGLYPITAATGTVSATTGYLLAFNSAGQLTVSARPITVTPGPLARPYGDPNPTTTGTLTVGGSGLVNGNTITQVDVTSPATATDPAGSAHALNASNAVFGGGGVASNYAITYAPGVLTISQRPITVLASNQARAYGDPNPTTGPYTITAGSLAGTDAIGSVNVTSPALSTSPAGGVWVLTNTGANFTTGNPANYTITLQNGQLTITPRTITLTAGSAARLYGDPNPVPAPLYTVGGNGMANAENAQTLFGFTVASGAIGTTPVGAYATGANAYNIAGVGVGANGNYTITAINPGTLTIGPAPLTISANNAARPEAQPNSPFSATYASFKNGETPAALGGTLAFATPATIASPPGAYAITPSGQTATNYTITYVNGVLTVTPVPVVPVPPVVSGVAAADNALITATQRSADAESDVAPRLPDAKSVDCLVLERPDVRRVLNRCY